VTKTIGVKEASIHFGEVLRGVTERGETFLIERGGKPQAVVLSIAEYERLRNGKDQEDDWWTLAERARERFARELGDRPMPDIVQIINESREVRDAEILAVVLRR